MVHLGVQEVEERIADLAGIARIVPVLASRAGSQSLLVGSSIMRGSCVREDNGAVESR